MKFLSDIVKYQTYMDGVDRGDQHRVMGAGFANSAHSKNGTKKYSWVLEILASYELMLRGFFVVEEMMVNSRRGEIKRKRLVK